MNRKPLLSVSTAMQFVLLMGFISLFGDMTYEGGRGIAGPYLGSLGASAFIVSVVAGAGEFIGYGLRLAFGYWSDKTRRYWLFTFAGYVVNVCAIPLLALTGAWPSASALLLLERAGKGVRTPSRDVMLSHATETMGRGWGFGVHEAMDQTGAMLGPLLIALLLHRGRSYHFGFAVLAGPAALSIITLCVCFRLFPNPESLEGKAPPLKTTGLPRAFWIYLGAMCLLAAGYVDFALIAFHIARTTHIALPWIPVFYAGAMGVQALGALGFGWIFDRLGLRTLGVAYFLSAFFALFAFQKSFASIVVGMILWGLGMGAQDSVMRAAVANMVPKEHRGAAYGIFNSCYGAAWLAGSATLGFLYSRSMTGLIAFSMICQWASIPVLLRLQRAPSR